MPSESHIDLGHMALTWLENKATQRGTRSCVEITLGEGYVADAAAICGLQDKWERKFGIGFKQQFASDRVADDLSFVFESKVSRSDFQNTFKRNKHKADRLVPRGNFHFVVTEKKIVTIDDIPDPWGWLECSGPGLSVRKLPVFCPHSKEHLHEFANRILRYTTAWKKYNVEAFNLRLENHNAV